MNKMKKRILKSGEKELLIKDLLPRIPTGLFVDVPDEKEPKKLEKVVRWRIVYGRARSLEDCLDGLIPYLRPISSMTEEENKEYFSIWTGSIRGDMIAKIDFYIKHYFDFRLASEGLSMIETGLAIEAPEGMYN